MSSGTPRAYYSTFDQMPPLNVRVHVLWDGRAFEAARVKDKRGMICWLTHISARSDSRSGSRPDRVGTPVFLPLTAGERRDSLADALARTHKGKAAPAPWAGFHTLKSPQPDFWAPLVPQSWALTLPPVALLYDSDAAPGTAYHTERLRFAAVEDAEAADLAREMEHNRAAAAAGSPEGSRRGPQKRVLWWMDATRVTYSPPGRITIEEAEGRLMRALAAEEFGATAAGLGLGLARGMHPDDLRALAEHEAKYPQGFDPRFTPLPADHADSDRALSWFLALGPVSPGGGTAGLTLGQQVLVYASRDLALSFAAIGKILRVPSGSPSGESERATKSASKVYRAAIAQVTAIANGAETDGTRARARALADLKARNRRGAAA